MSLANYIERDLESRIRHGRDLPGPLTLQSLAAHYGVSLTPIREATESLLSRGLLVKMNNRRLAVSTSVADIPADDSGTSHQPPTDWDAVLTRHVLLQSLQGEAIFLREEALAERFGIGRTLLRQVFSRMAGAGIIEHVPRRGWRIRPLNDADLAAYLEIRELLERKALQLARPRLVTIDIEAMLEENRPLDGSVAPRIDNQLHQYFIEKSENRYIRDFFSRHGGYYRALFDYAALGLDVIAEMAAQHREILEQILAERWTEAEEALGQHIRAQRPIVRRMMKHLEEMTDDLS